MRRTTIRRLVDKALARRRGDYHWKLVAGMLKHGLFSDGHCIIALDARERAALEKYIRSKWPAGFPMIDDPFDLAAALAAPKIGDAVQPVSDEWVYDGETLAVFNRETVVPRWQMIEVECRHKGCTWHVGLGCVVAVKGGVRVARLQGVIISTKMRKAMQP